MSLTQPFHILVQIPEEESERSILAAPSFGRKSFPNTTLQEDEEYEHLFFAPRDEVISPECV